MFGGLAESPPSDSDYGLSIPSFFVAPEKSDPSCLLPSSALFSITAELRAVTSTRRRKWVLSVTILGIAILGSQGPTAKCFMSGVLASVGTPGGSTSPGSAWNPVFSLISECSLRECGTFMGFNLSIQSRRAYVNPKPLGLVFDFFPNLSST